MDKVDSFTKVKQLKNRTVICKSFHSNMNIDRDEIFWCGMAVLFKLNVKSINDNLLWEGYKKP